MMNRHSDRILDCLPDPRLKGRSVSLLEFVDDARLRHAEWRIKWVDRHVCRTGISLPQFRVAVPKRSLLVHGLLAKDGEGPGTPKYNAIQEILIRTLMNHSLSRRA